MKEKKEIEKELEVRKTRLLTSVLPPNTQSRSEADFERGYISALEWVLDKSE